MQNAGAQQRRYSLRRATHVLQRWLVLVLVVAVSGLVSVAGNGHVAHAAVNSHELTLTDHDTGVALCCPEHDNKPGSTMDCGATSCCPLCAPVVASAIPALWNAVSVKIRPESIHLGRAPPPQLRPPKFIRSV